MDLTAIANDSGTDKGTLAGLGHGYTLFYELLLSSRRLEPLNFCEIGLCRGGPEVEDGSIERVVPSLPSVEMWHAYLPNAKLYGIDISDFSSFETEWFKFFRADCGEEAQLKTVADLGIEFDVILDDGSHAPFHQQQTFLSLFPALRPGGLFIIEDIQWQPSTYAFKLPAVPRTDDLFRRFVQQGHFSDTGALPVERWTALAGDIKSVFLIDEDWLYEHRRQYNARHGLKPATPTLADGAPGSHLRNPRFWKRLAGRVRSELQGPLGEARRPRAKLAVIQKV
jgi:hypothetical protein